MCIVILSDIVNILHCTELYTTYEFIVGLVVINRSKLSILNRCPDHI